MSTPPNHARILITGSRSWPDPELLADTLLQVWHDALENGYAGILVTHGTAEGADELADLWAAGHGIPVDRHPADWAGACAPSCPPSHRRPRRGTDYCPHAGHRRNQLMVDLKPDLCVAFHHANSRGTADAIRRVTAAGIPILRITA